MKLKNLNFGLLMVLDERVPNSMVSHPVTVEAFHHKPQK